MSDADGTVIVYRKCTLSLPKKYANYTACRLLHGDKQPSRALPDHSTLRPF